MGEVVLYLFLHLIGLSELCIRKDCRLCDGVSSVGALGYLHEILA